MTDFFTSALDFLAKGGVLMIFIFLCSIAAIVFFIERLIALKSARRQMTELSKPLQEAIESNQYERAMTLCDSHPCALGALAQTALKNQQRTREGIQEAVSDEAKIQFAKLERFIPAIGIIASISPLLGLLGTVTGMIQVFSKLDVRVASQIPGRKNRVDMHRRDRIRKRRILRGNKSVVKGNLCNASSGKSHFIHRIQCVRKHQAHRPGQMNGT